MKKPLFDKIQILGGEIYFHASKNFQLKNMLSLPYDTTSTLILEDLYRPCKTYKSFIYFLSRTECTTTGYKITGLSVDDLCDDEKFMKAIKTFIETMPEDKTSDVVKKGKFINAVYKLRDETILRKGIQSFAQDGLSR